MLWPWPADAQRARRGKLSKEKEVTVWADDLNNGKVVGGNWPSCWQQDEESKGDGNELQEVEPIKKSRSGFASLTKA